MVSRLDSGIPKTLAECGNKIVDSVSQLGIGSSGILVTPGREIVEK